MGVGRDMEKGRMEVKEIDKGMMGCWEGEEIWKRVGKKEMKWTEGMMRGGRVMHREEIK